MDGTTNVMTEAIESLFGVATTALNYIVENPYLAIFFFASVVGIGIGVMKKLK